MGARLEADGPAEGAGVEETAPVVPWRPLEPQPLAKAAIAATAVAMRSVLFAARDISPAVLTRRR
jgi:hypothetical protein